MSTCPHPPRMYFRYVDDTFNVLKERYIQEFHDHINSLNDSIRWTREEEKDGQLPIMDVLITRKPDGCISTSVYRKPTHTDLYIHYNSQHPRQCKLGIIRTLVRRAKTICSEDTLVQKEIDHVKMAMTHCGYTKWAWKMANRPSREKVQVEESVGMVTIPYVQGVSETLKRIFSRQNLRVAFKPVATIVSEQASINEAGEAVTVVGKGRHDPCVVPRAVPIVEAMTALVLADHVLLARTNKI